MNARRKAFLFFALCCMALPIFFFSPQKIAATVFQTFNINSMPPITVATTLPVNCPTDGIGCAVNVTNTTPIPVLPPGCTVGPANGCVVEPVVGSENFPTQVCDPTTQTRCMPVDSNNNARTKICDRSANQCATVDASNNIAASINNGANEAGVDANGNLRSRVCDNATSSCETLQGLDGLLGGAAPANNLPVQAFLECAYYTSTITATNANRYPLQCDSNGNLKTTGTTAVNQSKVTAGYSFILDSAGSNVASVDSNGNQYYTLRNGTNAATVDANGVQKHILCDNSSSTTCAKIQTPSDGLTLGNALSVNAAMFGYNGSAQDRIRSSNKELQTTSGGSTLTAIASASNLSSCTSEVAASTNLHQIWSAAASETATVSIYTNNTCTATSLIWSGIPSTTPTRFDAAVAGIYVKTSGATANNTLITSN